MERDWHLIICQHLPAVQLHSGLMSGSVAKSGEDTRKDGGLSTVQKGVCTPSALGGRGRIDDGWLLRPEGL